MHLICLKNSMRCIFYKVVCEWKVCVSVENYPKICGKKSISPIENCSNFYFDPKTLSLKPEMINKKRYAGKA